MIRHALLALALIIIRINVYAHTEVSGRDDLFSYGKMPLSPDQKIIDMQNDISN